MSYRLLFLAILLISGINIRAQEQPNIILINVDDMGWKDTGFMGSEYYETPSIDSLSEKGMVFSNGYASAANCAPSRANMLSGKYPQYHGVYTVGSSERGKSSQRKIVPLENTTTIPERFLLLPQALKKNGYATAHAGKWHISEDPLKKGFDINIGGSHAGHPASYYPPYQNVNLKSEGYLTDAIMNKVIGFIDKTESPFFLNYSPYAVHTPIQPVDSLLYKYVSKASWNGQDNPEYATMVENLDRNIGKLIRALKNKGVYKNTIIIFTSDNGGLYGITKQKPLRAGKGSYYEGGIRVPFFFVWEGHILPNSENPTPISNLDLYPTIMNLCNAENDSYPGNLDGSDLTECLLNNKIIEDRDLYWNFPIYLQRYQAKNENRDPLFRTRPGSAIRSGKWKLLYYYEDEAIELYDLHADISETNNLSKVYTSKAQELKLKLINWIKSTGAKIPKDLNPDYKMVE